MSGTARLSDRRQFQMHVDKQATRTLVYFWGPEAIEPQDFTARDHIQSHSLAGAEVCPDFEMTSPCSGLVPRTSSVGSIFRMRLRMHCGRSKVMRTTEKLNQEFALHDKGVARMPPKSGPAASTLSAVTRRSCDIVCDLDYCELRCRA
jgi:hypothetical protein